MENMNTVSDDGYIIWIYNGSRDFNTSIFGILSSLKHKCAYRVSVGTFIVPSIY